ncbi:hypothetical protein ABTD32_19430, partial [Acinetobacter baumannii]
DLDLIENPRNCRWNVAGGLTRAGGIGSSAGPGHRCRMEGGDSCGDGVSGRHWQTRAVTRQSDTSMQRSDTQLLAMKKISGEMVADQFLNL